MGSGDGPGMRAGAGMGAAEQGCVGAAVGQGLLSKSSWLSLHEAKCSTLPSRRVEYILCNEQLQDRVDIMLYAQLGKRSGSEDHTLQHRCIWFTPAGG